MRFCVNWFKVDFRVTREEDPPIGGAVLEEHVYGVPPLDVRKIWVVEIKDLEELEAHTRVQGQELVLSLSSYWTGTSINAPGSRMPGIAILNDPLAPEIDVKDQPVAIRQE